MSKLEQLIAAHARLKHRIHSFRVPIQSKYGIFGMGCIYFSIPVVAGYFVMEFTNQRAKANLGEKGELLLLRKREWEQMSSTPTVVMAKTPEPHRVNVAPAKQL